MKYDPETATITVNGEKQNQINIGEDDSEGWKKLQGQTMQVSFENGEAYEFEAYNIRPVEKEK